VCKKFNLTYYSRKDGVQDLLDEASFSDVFASTSGLTDRFEHAGFAVLLLALPQT